MMPIRDSVRRHRESKLMPSSRKTTAKAVALALTLQACAAISIPLPFATQSQATPPVADKREDEDKAACPMGPDGKPKPCRAEVERHVPHVTPPPASVNGWPAAPPPSAPAPGSRASGYPTGLAVSYFQRGKMKLDTRNAFGMVIIPRKAVDQREMAVQRQFCEFVLASLDFETPGDINPAETLATYWPTIAEIDQVSLEMAFASHDCQNLIAWYDHKMARDIAAKTGLLDKGGPLLVTWPSERSVSREKRDPLVVDFANANRANTKRALAYWFRQLSQDPSLWTDRIREGTIRAELADAINETAGVMLAVLSGKWEGLTQIPDGRS